MPFVSKRRATATRGPGRPPKNPPLLLEVPASIEETPSDIAKSIYTESLWAIREEIRGIATGRIIPTEHDPASRIAWLARQAATVASEQRKADAAEAKRVDAITRAQIMAHLRQLDATERSAVIREAQRIDTEDTVLA